MRWNLTPGPGLVCWKAHGHPCTWDGPAPSSWENEPSVLVTARWGGWGHTVAAIKERLTETLYLSTQPTRRPPVIPVTGHPVPECGRREPPCFGVSCRLCLCEPASSCRPAGRKARSPKSTSQPCSPGALTEQGAPSLRVGVCVSRGVCPLVWMCL